MNKGNKKEPGHNPGQALLSRMQWIWLVTGILMTVIGGALKVYDIYTSPAVFEYVFFSGASYILLAAGLVLVIMALAYDILFWPEGEED